MGAEVHMLPGVTAPDRAFSEQPDQEIVELLETLLKEAQEGSLQAVAVVTARTGRRIGTAWVGNQRGYKHDLAAGISYLTHRFYIESNEPD